MAQSIAERRKEAQKTEKSANNPVESFFQYVAHPLSELDPGIRHLAQHKISQVPLQAQTGPLVLESPYGYMAPKQPQPHSFQLHKLPCGPTCMNNLAVSTYSQFDKNQQCSSPQMNKYAKT